MSKEEAAAATVNEELIAPGLIVRHTSRRLGKLDPCEACKRLILGEIAFSEFVDQVGEDFRELLDFMIDHDLHPGRPEDVIYCIDCYARLSERRLLRSQLQGLYTYAPEPQSVG